MDTFAAEQLAMLAGGHPAATEQIARRCVLFGCLETAAWVVSDPQGGELPVCEIDLDLLLNDALAWVPPDSSIRVEVWRARGSPGIAAPVGATDPSCGRAGAWLSSPVPIVAA
jgi:hypothetical protein